MEDIEQSSQTLQEFLVRLRGKRTQQQVGDLLAIHGGTSTRQAVNSYELGRRGLSSRVQLAYVRAFSLSMPEALLLQRLAGEAFARAA